MVTELERIKAKRATFFSLKSLCVERRKSRKKLGAPLRMNSEFNLEENVLSKWCEQGALRSESTGSKFCSDLDGKIYG